MTLFSPIRASISTAISQNDAKDFCSKIRIAISSQHIITHNIAPSYIIDCSTMSETQLSALSITQQMRDLLDELDQIDLGFSAKEHTEKIRRETHEIDQRVLGAPHPPPAPAGPIPRAVKSVKNLGPLPRPVKSEKPEPLDPHAGMRVQVLSEPDQPFGNVKHLVSGSVYQIRLDDGRLRDADYYALRFLD